MRCVIGSSGHHAHHHHHQHHYQHHYHSSSSHSHHSGAQWRSTTLPTGVQLGGGLGDATCATGHDTCTNVATGGGHSVAGYGAYVNHCNGPQLWSFSARTITLLAVSLVFILIWSSVIAAVLLTHSYKEQESAQQMVQLFLLHQDIAHLAYTVGSEMLYSLNASLTQQTTPATDGEAKVANQTASESTGGMRAKWNETEQVLSEVSVELARQGFLEFETLAREKLDTLRVRCVDYLAGVNLSRSALADCARAFDRLFYSVDLMLVRDNHWLSERHSKLTVADLTIRDMPYTLFVRGMIHRFTALGLGIILTRFGTPDASLNVTEYLHYHYSSRQQIESSFLWSSRFFQKYLELERSEHQSDTLLEQIDSGAVHRWQMAHLMSHIFTRDSLDRLRSYSKKKNVESVELALLGAEGELGTKFVTVEQDLHRVPLQLNGQLFDSFGVDHIEQLVGENQFLLSQRYNASQRYDEHVRQQVRFLARMQDFLNVSIYSHLAQMHASEEQTFIYHTMVATILILSVLFCLVLASVAYLFCASRHSACFMETTKPLLSRGRVGRRHFWNPSNYFSAHQVAPGQGRSSTQHGHHHHGHQHCHHQQQSLVFPCPSSPNAFLVSSSSKRTFAGGVINRYLATPVGGGSSSSTKTALLTYKFENSRTKSMETTSLMGPDRGGTDRLSGPTCATRSDGSELDSSDSRHYCCCCCTAVPLRTTTGTGSVTFTSPGPVKPSPKGKSPKQTSSASASTSSTVAVESKKPNKEQSDQSDPLTARNASTTAKSSTSTTSSNNEGTM